MGLKLVFLGLSITSSWGNGHATTYRALLGALAKLGHEITFLERDVPWYASQRDLSRLPGCRIELYDSLDSLMSKHGARVRAADAVIVGSYVPDGAEVMDWVLQTAHGLRLFYDIDTPITLADLASGKPTYIRPDSIPRLDGYLSFSGGAALRHLEQRHGARAALPLYCSVDAELYAPTGAPPSWLLGYLGTYSADRQCGVRELLLEPARELPDERFVVAGPSYPAEAWPSNVERIEHVAPAAHPAFYCSCAFTLNVTRDDMKQLGHSPSVRLFEAAACETPIISDAWTGLDEFFEPGVEILIAEDRASALRLLRNLPERARRELGVQARLRVLRQHTALHRARTLQRYLWHLLQVRAGSGASPRRPKPHEPAPVD